jgi:hypothetical protein
MEYRSSYRVAEGRERYNVYTKKVGARKGEMSRYLQIDTHDGNDQEQRKELPLTRLLCI